MFDVCYVDSAFLEGTGCWVALLPPVPLDMVRVAEPRSQASCFSDNHLRLDYGG